MALRGEKFIGTGMKGYDPIVSRNRQDRRGKGGTAGIERQLD